MSEPAPSQYSPIQGGEARAASSLPLAAWIAIAIAAFVVGLVIGAFAIGGGPGAAGAFDAPSVASEEKLDSPVASYAYNGSKTTVTVREVLEAGGMVEDALDTEGNYKLPSANTVLEYVRNQILLSEAKSQGIDLSDEEIAAYANETFGTSDYAELAQTYSISEDAVAASLAVSAAIDRLHSNVGGEGTAETEIAWSNYKDAIFAKASITLYELVS